MSISLKIKNFDNIEGFIKDEGSVYGLVKHPSKYVKGKLCKAGLIKFKTEAGLTAVYRTRGSEGKKEKTFLISNNPDLELQFILAEDIKTIFIGGSYEPEVLTESSYLKYNTIYGQYGFAVIEKLQEYLYKRVIDDIDNLRNMDNIFPSKYRSDVIREIKNVGHYNLKPWYPSIDLNNNRIINDANTVYEMIVDEKRFKEVADIIYNNNKKKLVESYLSREYHIKTAKELEGEKIEDIENHLIIKECISKYSESKTFNVTTKDGDTVKVESSILSDCNGSAFRTVRGWNTIHLVDIDKITFGRKIVFER